MADSDAEGSWWGGWLQTAKEKSAAALDFVKKDLAEFSTTTIDDTTKAAHVVKDQVKAEKAAEAGHKVKEGFNQLLGGINKVLAVEDQPDRARKYNPSSAGAIYNRFKSRLIAIQVDTGTYMNEPSGPPEKYEEWLKTFQFDNMKGEISELLVVNVEVRALYTQLVPGEVSHPDFWQRYFYKVHQLKEDEARKDELKKRAESAKQEADLGWEDEDDWGDITGPSSPPREAHFPASMAARTDSPPPAPPGDRTENTEETKTEEDEQSTEATTLSHNQPEPSESSETDSSPTEEKNTPPESVDLDKKEDVLVVERTDKQKEDDDDKDDTLTENSIEPEQEAVATVTDIKTETPSPITTIEKDPDASKTTELSIDTENLGRQDIEKELKVKERGDLVMVGSDRSTPTSTNSNNKESSSLDEDWEDFDIEVTEEDLKLAQEAAKKIGATPGKDDEEDDWENWD